MCVYITGHLNSVFPTEYCKEILRYIYCHQNEDGGWGLHIEGHSTMFCTVLSYITMRILGEGADGGKYNACARARKWILDHGSATAIPSWGKTWLSILGVFDWSGSNPMPPEFWLLPSFLPMHPAKIWCYCRMVYMPMSYLYGKRFAGPVTPLVLQLREELYLKPYEQINWWFIIGEKESERIDRCVKDKLLLFCDILNIPVNKSSAKKEDLSVKLLEFLESPHVTTEKLLADSEKGKKLKRKAKSSKSPSSVRKALKTTSKKQKLESKSEKKRKSPSKDEEEDDDEAERSENRDVSQDDDENDADAKEESDQDSKSEEEEEKHDADSKEESDQDSKSEEEEEKNDAELKEESDQDSKSEEEEEEENEKGKQRRQLTSKKSASKAVSKNDSGVKTADKSTSVKRTGPTKSSKTTPKLTKKSLMSTDDAEKNDTSVASGSSRKPKVPSTKKQKLDKEHEKDQSLSAKAKTSGKKEPSKSSTKSLAKDQGNKKGSKKAKPEPSKEEMHAVVADILKEVDFNTATLSDILRQLGTHFHLDLSHRKAEVRLIITDVISNMTDEDDDGEEDNGEDGEGDGEDDNNA